MYLMTTATRKIAQLDKKIRGVCGGTSASKTISILMWLTNLSQSDTTPTLTSIVSESTPHLRKGVRRDFKKIMVVHGYWKDSCWHDTNATYTFETGSQIEFFSAGDGDKLRGSRRDRLFINEANNITLEAFDQMEVRTKELVYLDWNPSSEFWFYTDVLGTRDDVDFITLTYKDNEALSKEIISAIEARKHNTNWWRVYGLGLLGAIENRIYTGWTEIDLIPKEAKLVRRGIDFGYSIDPTVIIAIYEYNGGFIIHEELYRKGMSNKSIADFINNTEERNVLCIADSAEPKSIEEIRTYGVNIKGATKGIGSVNQGINWIQDQKIYVTKNSVKTIKAYRNYLWVRDRNGKIIQTPDDSIHEWSNSMDAMRYGFNTYYFNKVIGFL